LAVANAIPEVAPVMAASFPSSFFGISILLRSHRPGFGKYRNWQVVSSRQKDAEAAGLGNAEPVI